MSDVIRTQMVCKSIGQLENSLLIAVCLEPDQSETAIEQNKLLSDDVPAATVIINIQKGKEALDQFEIGKSYYVDFVRVEPVDIPVVVEGQEQEVAE